MSNDAEFSKEADLCAAFISILPKGWTAYSETAGFDILLVRDADQMQVGIEAKLALNVKVLTQILPEYSAWRAGETGPHYRAVLVPDNKSQNGLSVVCSRLGITVISLKNEEGQRWENGRIEPYHKKVFSPDLPKFGGHYYENTAWHEWCPDQPCSLPQYVPDVIAGNAAPVALTDWKIRAIQMAILLEARPVRRSDFKILKLSPSRWLDPHNGWLKPTPRGYVAGHMMPDFKHQHPVNYEQIKSDIATWGKDLDGVTP